MKRIVLFAVFACLGAAFAKTPEGWTDDYDAALRQAAAEKKTVLADFSGSDWCKWCQKLDQEVFSTADFRKAASQDTCCSTLICRPIRRRFPSRRGRGT